MRTKTLAEVIDDESWGEDKTDKGLSCEATCSIAWTTEPPNKIGLYMWRVAPGNMLAIVYVVEPPDGKLIGKVYGQGGRHFYEACDVTAWGGNWLGPLPQ